MAFIAPEEELDEPLKTRPPSKASTETGFVAPATDAVKPFVAPVEDVEHDVQKLAADRSFDHVSHATQYKPGDPEWETAYQVEKAREIKTVGDAAAATGRGVAKVVAHPWDTMGRGVWNFLSGFPQIAINTAQALKNNGITIGVGPVNTGMLPSKAPETLQAEATLIGQHGEESLKHTARAMMEWGSKPLGTGKHRFRDEDGNLMEDTGEELRAVESPDDIGRKEFEAKVQAQRNAQQLAEGRPIETGAIAGIYHAAGQSPGEEVGPEELARIGAPQADQAVVERGGAASDPNNLALVLAPQLPFAKTIGGAVTEAAGHTLQVPGRIAGAAGSAATKLVPTTVRDAVSAMRAIANPTKAVTGAAVSKGSRGLQKVGEILAQQGKELRTGAPSPLTTAAATAAARGERAIGTNVARKFGDTVAHGATTAAGMAPMNALLAEGDPEKFVELEAGAAAFGGTLSAFRRNRAGLVEGVRPYLRSEGARALAEAGEGNDPLAAKSGNYLMGLPEEARDRALEVIGTLQGLPIQAKGGSKRAKVYVLSEPDYLAAQAQIMGGQQAAMGGGRGFFHGDDGSAYVNGDFHSGLNPAELVHTVGHEFGGHAAMNILRAAGARGGALYDGLIGAAKRGLFNRDGVTPTPEFKRFIDGYNEAFDPAAKAALEGRQQHKQIDASDPAAVEEFISETAGQILAHRGAGEIAVPRNIQDKIADGLGRFMGQTLGIGQDPDHIGTETKFSREEVGDITRAVQDTLSQIAGMKLREGAEIPEAPKNRETRIAELKAVLEKPKPGDDAPFEATHEWIKERAQARQEIAALESDGSEEGTASTKAKIESPPAVTEDAMKMLAVMKIGKNKATNLIRQANEQHGSPIMDPGHLAAGALRIHGKGSVKPGEFTPKPAAPKAPVPIPVGDNATFTDETGTKRVITGPSPDAVRVGDVVATRDGEVRRITSIKGDTVDTARPIDPLTARGTKTHKLEDILPLAHDYAPEPTPVPGATPAPAATPAAFTVVPAAGGRFKVVDAAGNPVNSKTYSTESAANQAIVRTGKKSTFGLPPSASGNDVLDSIIENGGINLSGMSREESEHSFPHRGIWRNELTSDSPDNTPDEIARLVAADGHGDGTVNGLWGMIDAAIKERNNFRSQQVKAELEQIAAEKAAKNGPQPEPTPEPTTDPTGENGIPPEPTVTTAVSERPPDAPEPVTISHEDVAKLAAEAEAAVVAARAGTKKTAATLPKEVTAAQVDAVAAAHDQGLPANYQGVRLRTDSTGKTTISGTFNPSRPFDAFLLKLADISEHAQGVLQTLQSNIGKTITLNYSHAPESEDGVTAGSRKKAQAASSAQARASGESEAQAEDKNFIPLEVRFNKGSDKGPSITVLGASPEKLLNNFNLARAAVQELGGEVPYRDIHDPHLVGDMKGVARNHQNGWKGDGSAKIESFPDQPVTATEGYTPYPIPAERFEFLNLILGDESAKTGKRGQSPEQKLKQGLAAKNQIPMTDAGETNMLRQSINQAKGEVNGTMWSLAMIEKPLNETIRVDLVNEVKDELSNDDASIRRHGYKGSIDRLFSEGIPDRAFTAAGFLPIEGKPSSAQEKARERIAQREGVTREKLVPSYQKIAEEKGFPAIPISELQKRSGVDMETLKKFLTAEHNAGRAVLSAGDWSISTPEEHAGNIKLHGQDMLQVRFPKADWPESIRPKAMPSEKPTKAQERREAMGQRPDVRQAAKDRLAAAQP